MLEKACMQGKHGQIIKHQAAQTGSCHQDQKACPETACLNESTWPQILSDRGTVGLVQDVHLQAKDNKQQPHKTPHPRRSGDENAR